MIAEFEDFCLWMYVVGGDGHAHRPGRNQWATVAAAEQLRLARPPGDALQRAVETMIEPTARDGGEQ